MCLITTLLFLDRLKSDADQGWEAHPCQPAVPILGAVSPHGSHQENNLGQDLFLVLGSIQKEGSCR